MPNPTGDITVASYNYMPRAMRPSQPGIVKLTVRRKGERRSGRFCCIVGPALPRLLGGDTGYLAPGRTPTGQLLAVGYRSEQVSPGAAVVIDRTEWLQELLRVLG